MALISPESDNKKLIIFIIASTVFSVLSLIFFGIGYQGYERKEFIEHGLNLLGAGEHKLLAFLLFLPFGALLTGIPILIWKAYRDDDTALFYSFCLLLMSLTPFSYCVLWAVYVRGGWATQTGQTKLSWAALIVIGLLVASVIYMTYLIMWSPAQVSPFLKLSDIKTWKGFCEALQRKYEATTSEHDHPSLLARLPAEERQLVLNAPNTLGRRKFPKEAMLPVVMALNELMTRDDFLETKEFDDLGVEGANVHASMNGTYSNESDSSANEVQILHRCFLDLAYAGIIQPLNKTGSLRLTVRSGKYRLTGFQLRLKEGVIKSPFWATVFFFTIFLGITYLFCFAFAFHDRANLLAEKRPALFSPRAPLYSVGDYTIAADVSSKGGRAALVGDWSPENYEWSGNLVAPSWPEYVFYFDFPDAEFRHGKRFNQAAFDTVFNKLVAHRMAVGGSKGEISADGKIVLEPKRLSPAELKEVNTKWNEMHEDWKQSMNSERLTRLVEAISSEDYATHGQGLQILLRGEADESSLTAGERPGASYPSNYTLSEARAQAVNYVLLERLANSGRLQGNFQWVIIPMSNEETSVPKSPHEMKAHEEQGNPSFDEELTKMGHRLPYIVTQHREHLSTQFERISALFKGKLKSSEKGKNTLLGKLKLAIDLNLEADNPMDELWLAQAKRKQQATVAVAEAVDAIRHEHVDEAAGKRVVIVSVKPVQHIPGHGFAPLSLMDYMYFTIYTITTTGYGDIVPTTTYAKFLCSSANILEVFFFVVFFNGLLSMKRSQGHALGEGAPGGGGSLNVGRLSTSGAAGGKGDADPDKVLEEIREIKVLLENLSNSKNWRKWLPWSRKS